MKAAFLEQIARRDLGDMPFEDRLALLIDREVADRRSRALQRRLKRAKLRQQDACFEEINLSRPRGLDRSVVLALGDCAWIHNGAPILITGPTGTGKSWISCALAHKACLEGFQALYLRVPRLLNELRLAHGEGTIAKLYRDLARIDLLVLDDWGLAPIEPARGRDLLQILDDRSGRRPVIVTSQLPVPRRCPLPIAQPRRSAPRREGGLPRRLTDLWRGGRSGRWFEPGCAPETCQSWGRSSPTSRSPLAKEWRRSWIRTSSRCDATETSGQVCHDSVWRG